MMGLRIDPRMKAFFQQVAKKENRNLSNFIINSVLTYIKEHWDLEYVDDEKQE